MANEQKSKVREIDIAKEAIDIVRAEKNSWEDAQCFVTEKVAFNMRNVIRKCRKNYYGVFDTQQDSNTGRDKIWIHLTQEFVDNFCPTRDLDTKDINVKSKHNGAIGKTQVIRQDTKNYLDYTYFGEDLDEGITNLGVDGTFVWQTLPYYDKVLKREIAKRIPIDLLNCYIDPTSRSIQEAYRFTVRNVLTPDEIRRMGKSQGWINLENLKGTTGLDRSDDKMNGSNFGSNVKALDIWFMEGKAPKYLMTGDPNDDEDIDLRIVVSGLSRSGMEKVHLIEEYNGVKTYEECWAKRVPNRWYGLGIAEKLIWYQVWANITANTRITRQTVAQLGIFKIKKGAGITPQMISRLAVNGAITVNSMDDVENFPIQEPGVTSYKDDDVIQQRAMRVTGMHEAATGEQLPSSTPATNAILQNNASQSIASLTKEGIGMFLQRWIKRQVWPINIPSLTAGTVIRMEMEPDELRKYDEQRVNKRLHGMLSELDNQGIMFDGEQALMAKAAAIENLKNSGAERLVTVDEVYKAEYYDVEVFITNENIDKNVLSTSLLSALSAAPEYKEQIMQAFFDLAGLNLKPLQQPQQMLQQPQMAQPQQTPTPNLQRAVTNANVPV